MAQDLEQSQQASQITEKAVAEGGAYEVIRRRLIEQGGKLNEQAKALNNARLDEFGSSEMRVSARVRVRTENNSIARDIVQVGELLLFGYNVFIGLKKETKIADVFSVFRVHHEQDSSQAFHDPTNSSSENNASAAVAMAEVALGDTFLSQPGFVNDFDELYRYYKNTRLIQLTVKDSKLLAGFQIGERIEDIRVFRWSVSADGKQVDYIDNRGERDIKLPSPFDFEWTPTRREDVVHGRHAHINILDTIFVEAIGGDLTVKIENNTEDGLGIFQEAVEDETQSIDDANIAYAIVGKLILLSVKPYREDTTRYLIFNTMTQAILRVDAIGQSCIQLPEDHGIIFPGGYYLETGEYKNFEEEYPGLTFKRQLRSPNGEDVLYIFYESVEGVVGLLAYNLIEKSIQNPIYGHGYALADNGTLILFSAEGEPTRIHPMQIWTTPFVSEEFASNAPPSHTFYGRIGNSELVRGISDLFSICRLINKQEVSSRLYEELLTFAKKYFDNHYWAEEPDVTTVAALLRDIANTAELVIDEFEKVESIRQQSAKSMRDAEQTQQQILQSLRPENWSSAEHYVEGLHKIHLQRGKLATIKELRYIDQHRIAALDDHLLEAQQKLSQQTVTFLTQASAFQPYAEKIDTLNKEVLAAETVAILKPLLESMATMASGLDLLTELMANLKVEDANVRTQIIDAISDVYARLNQVKAKASNKQKNVGMGEAKAQFGAQFKLLSQSITNALSMATTPERCDEQLSRLLIQLEELESQFSEFEDFLADIMEKREEIYESFEGHKQQLLDARQRKAQTIIDGANRILSSVERRSLKFTEADKLNTFFAADTLVQKVREAIVKLRSLENNVPADDIESRLKASAEQAIRSLRDKSDIYEDGGKIIKLGPRHRFSVNTQELDLTILPRDGELFFHLTGSDFFEPVASSDLTELSDYWELSLESETREVYRAEYLSMLILDEAETGRAEFTIEDLRQALPDDERLNKIVRDFASPRYKEGYQKGVHDHDATLILKTLLPALETAELLVYNPASRALAQIFWANQVQPLSRHPGQQRNSEAYLIESWKERAESAFRLKQTFADTQAIQLLETEITATLTKFLGNDPIEFTPLEIREAAAYLTAELGRERLEFIASKYAIELVDEFKRSLSETAWRTYQAAQEQLQGQVAKRWQLGISWFAAMVAKKQLNHLKHFVPEAVALLNAGERIERRQTQVDLQLNVDGLLGDHPLIDKQSLEFALDEFMLRLRHHSHEVVPAYHRYLSLRQEIIEAQRDNLRLAEFKARPLSSFVRNRLINEAYLPIIGDNLAKQMGTVGDKKRTDLMGLLMMISPPGYGKTTLMEYVASRLGLTFMKINCPSLGHDVLSLDPQQAPNATARQELEKLNLALEMGNNVMLYLDDIQHTHPEFLQKFISLCDGTRRIEGIWKGKTRTYDMRGKKFCVVMAGNPYTESGELFKIPDMLANRADIYNLGDILGGMDEQFALSYIENSLTSNPALAPLATREMEDTYKLIKMAQGEAVATSDLQHQYSGAEINEITAVLQKLFTLQEIILKINQQYIASAAQDDSYRTEPSFKLQGSYRNMNKMAEKISSVMNAKELMQLVSDHYLGESQLLTTGAEENLLKLAELRGNMTSDEQTRWSQIKKDFLRNKAMGGSDADTGSRVVAQLADMVDGMGQLTETIATMRRPENDAQAEQKTLSETASLQVQQHMMTTLEKISKSVTHVNPEINLTPTVNVTSPPIPGLDKILSVMADTLQHSLYPLVYTMDKKIDIDLKTQQKMSEVLAQLEVLQADVKGITPK